MHHPTHRTRAKDTKDVLFESLGMTRNYASVKDVVSPEEAFVRFDRLKSKLSVC
mgnify:CR=1 FL=1